MSKLNQPDPLAPAIAAEVARLQAQDEPLKRATAEVLPGPLADAFALAQDITVGPFKVRAFVDRDFEFLRILKHPLDTMYKDEMAGRSSGVQFLPTGLPMWQVAFIMTRPVKETKSLLAVDGGIANLNTQAEELFADLPTKALFGLFEAIMRQVAISSSTAVAYGPGEEEAAKATENPPLSLLQRTGSGG